MLVGIVGTQDMGVLIQIRAASNTCVIKLNNGTLKKNVALQDVEEARDMSDTKEKQLSPIRLGGAETSPSKTPTRLAALSIDTRRSTDKLLSSQKAGASAVAVGDAVRARSNGGSRWFPGKIRRVRRDGTFDVEYTDGELEEGMQAADIEVVTALSQPTTMMEAASPAKKRLGGGGRSGFAVGDKVKARYKNGSKFFSGEVARARSDGTYDITYDDGDQEMKVPEALIEAFGPSKSAGNDGSDEDRGLKPSRKKPWGVGQKVKARYKKGKRLFDGKILRARSDGTYDVEYDDGDVETRVEASLIEAGTVEKDDLFADSDDEKSRTTTATKKKKGSWGVGDRVQAFYGKGKRLFPGRITKVHLNGTFDVGYDDGDSETRVPADLIQGSEAEDAVPASKSGVKAENKPLSSSKGAGKRPLRVGDAVKARYKGGTKFFPGKITRERSDGSFDVKYEDGDSEMRVDAARIQREGDELDSDDRKEQASLKVGDVVKARYKKGSKLFAGQVTRVRDDDTYDIEYDDGDVETRVERRLIEAPEAKRPEKNEKSGLSTDRKHPKVGDKVRARYKKGSKFFRGEITAVRRDETFDIRYDDGDKEKFVALEDIEPEEEEEERRSPSRKELKPLRVGDRVTANYNNGSKQYPGQITRVHVDGTYDVKYSDGDSERRVERARIKAESDGRDDSEPKKAGFAVGDAVKAKYKGGSKFFPGKITRKRPDGTFDVEYDDGDTESRIDAALIVAGEAEGSKEAADSSQSSRKKTKFEVGDVVKARYKKGARFFPGKIARVHSDGTYTVNYEDGDSETRVDSALIEGEAGKAEEKKRKGFSVGDKVTAQYKRGLKWFPGKIVKARTDGTFDIQYDDGDVEMRVSSTAIEAVAEPEAKKSKPEAKAQERGKDVDSDGKGGVSRKERGVLKVGDVVEANFKLKGKFHRGKVVRVRSDKTVDIEYDVGASEQRVQAVNIKRIGGEQTSSGESDGANGREVAAKAKKKAVKPSKAPSSDSDDDFRREKAKKPKRMASDSSGLDSEPSTPLRKGQRVTFRKAEDAKSRRIGVIHRVHSDGSCDVKYEEGDKLKRITHKSLVCCSDSEDSDEDSATNASKKQLRGQEGPDFRRNQRVLADWRRSSKFSKPRMAKKWTKATVLEANADGTYTIRYSDGVVEEDAPKDALKPLPKEKRNGSSSDEGSGKEAGSNRRRKGRAKRDKAPPIGVEALFLLEQLAMTVGSAFYVSYPLERGDKAGLTLLSLNADVWQLFEEGSLKTKPKLTLSANDSDSSSSESSPSSSEASGSDSSKSSKKKTAQDRVLRKLFDSTSLQTYRRLFKANDPKESGKISQSRLIAIVEELIPSPRAGDEDQPVHQVLTDWFASHEDLRRHRHFEFKTFLLAFAYAKHRLGKLRMEATVATVLEGRFASHHEHKRQLELWQQKLGFRLFETLQRHFHDRAMPNLIPSRLCVSELGSIFTQVARNAVSNKPLELYLQQNQMLPHQTLLLPEFLCCYYQLYGSASTHSTSASWNQTLELRPIAFVASCLFSNGDVVCHRHGDLIRRLSVGRTSGQVDLILRFREAFEALLNTGEEGGSANNEEKLLKTSQLTAFAGKVAADPTILEPALTVLRKRSAAVSLVEVFASCGFVIDELTSKPTIKNATEKLRMRVEVSEVRRILNLVRNVCLKILRFPNNADYWRIRADSAAFQQKLGRFDGATDLLEAVGFVEYHKTHFELRGARNADGKRVSALEKTILEELREKCVQLDGELSRFDGVESVSSILQRVAQAREQEGRRFTLEECQAALKYLAAYLENVLKNPKDSRCWHIREANGTFQRQIGALPFAVELMEAIGFELEQTSHGNVFVLRGTGPRASSEPRQGASQSASLANFTFSSVSSQTEWFLWRRKQEIDSLLEDEMQYLHSIVGASNRPNEVIIAIREATATEVREAAMVKMYPYGTNALETFNRTSVQQRQLEMMKLAFEALDVDQKGILFEADFSRALGAASALPSWSRFDAFDIGKDGKVDFPDFVAALGPLLDHSYELATLKHGQKAVTSSDDPSDPTMCEATSMAVGALRLGASSLEAAAALESLLTHLFKLIEEPDKQALWVVSDKMAIGAKLLRFPAGRELLRLIGFREDAVEATNDSEVDSTVRAYTLQPQRVRFKTSKSPAELPQALDSATISRLQTIAGMLAGHYRGLNHPTISDISAVSRAIAAPSRRSECWLRVVQLAVKCLVNIASHPENDRYRELNTATNTYVSVVGSVQGGPELLLSIGFRETDTGTLAVPMDVALEELEARRLELEVGSALLLQAIESESSEREPAVRSGEQSSKSTRSGGEGDRRPGLFIQRGALIRIGAELRDLDEERTVEEVVDYPKTKGLTRLRFATPLRFFHPAKELVSCVPLSSTEVAKRLEQSDLEVA
ncbi:hypothetical protein BBJ28_00012921 [Nothophytophthora sp. Chile5]|nr:hypothetical protein BBJ28_00012921 [Nothophytophthora sp. Chile5]